MNKWIVLKIHKLVSLSPMGCQCNSFYPLGDWTERAETFCSTSVLESVETLIVQLNEYTDTGIAYIARALISNNTLTHPDETLNKIGECVERITPKKFKLLSFSPSLQSEEAVKEWIQSVVVGGNSLICSLEHNQVTDFIILINISFRFNTDDVKTQL